MFDFNKPTCRKGTGSLKWDEDFSVEFPLWVADMDFEACPAVKDALRERVEHGIFGYVTPGEEFYGSILAWHRRRHGANYKREWMITVPGIVPAISAILRALTRPGQGVLLLSPAYNCFYSSIRNLGCRAEECKLVPQEDSFGIDFADLEEKAGKEDVNVMLLCNPHNPCGRIWTQEELQRIADICLKNNVFVVSDEIHCGLVMPGNEFITYSAVGTQFMENACVCTSASKTFNIAGLQNAQIICPNAELRSRIDKAVNIHEVCDVNPFGVVATQAAYEKGEAWLNELCTYIWGNYTAAKEYIETEIPGINVCRLDATYLMWVNISSLKISDIDFCQKLKDEQHVWLAEGSHYGSGGEGYVRINLATQRNNLMEALHRVKQLTENL